MQNWIRVHTGAFECIAYFEDADGDELTLTCDFFDLRGNTHQSTDPIWQNASLSLGDMAGCHVRATAPEGLSAERTILYSIRAKAGDFSP